jgi:flagellar biosynthesis/type III secretory pathway M-ring protein FliF/YscJ
MSWFPRPSTPSAAFADLRAFMRQRSREQKIGAALSLLVTLVIVIVFFVDSKINTAPPPYIVYVDSWSAKRTDAEIIAQQKKDQALVEAARIEKQKQFQALENQLGM